VCFKRDGVFAMELGGPKSAAVRRRASFTASSSWKARFHEWGFDYVLLDFLAMSSAADSGAIARDMCQKVIVVGSNDLQSLYVANNVCSAVEYFRKLAATWESRVW